jgi:hypothetical protein
MVDRGIEKKVVALACGGQPFDPCLSFVIAASRRKEYRMLRSLVRVAVAAQRPHSKA